MLLHELDIAFGPTVHRSLDDDPELIVVLVRRRNDGDRFHDWITAGERAAKDMAVPADDVLGALISHAEQHPIAPDRPHRRVGLAGKGKLRQPSLGHVFGKDRQVGRLEGIGLEGEDELADLALGALQEQHHPVITDRQHVGAAACRLALDLDVGRRDRLIGGGSAHGELAARGADRQDLAGRKPADGVDLVGGDGEGNAVVVTDHAVGLGRREVLEIARFRSPHRLGFVERAGEEQAFLVEGDAAWKASGLGPCAEAPGRRRRRGAETALDIGIDRRRGIEAGDLGITPGRRMLDPHQPVDVGRCEQRGGSSDGDTARRRRGRQRRRRGVDLLVGTVGEIHHRQGPGGMGSPLQLARRVVGMDDVHHVRRLGELELKQIGLGIGRRDLGRHAWRILDLSLIAEEPHV